MEVCKYKQKHFTTLQGRYHGVQDVIDNSAAIDILSL